MPSFTQTSSTSATAYTLAGGEVGYVGENATLSLASGDVVSVTGNARLTVLGNLYAQSGMAIAGNGLAGTSINLLVGEGATVISNTVASGSDATISCGGIITNYGQIYNVNSANAIVGNQGPLTVVNHGSIGLPAVDTFAIGFTATGAFRVDNFGTINGNVGANSTATSFQVTNGGTINGDITDFSNSNALVRNHGVVMGSISLSGGNDTYDGTGGRVYGDVFGSSGDDILTGGDFAERLFGGSEIDTLRGNGGVDSLFGDGGNDTIYFSIEDAAVVGGSGSDTARNTYDAFGLTFDVGGNGFEFYYGSQAGETIVTTAGIRIDVDAGGGDDLVVGSSVGDGISGGAGDDQLFGGAGPDTIGGGYGNDRITGGAGADVIFGEQGNDTFVFNGVGDAGDTITDFEIGRDKIEILRSGFDFSLQTGVLESNRLVAGPANQAFGQFLLDTGTGNVFWDGDGTGAGAAQFLFKAVGGLNHIDFFVV